MVTDNKVKAVQFNCVHFVLIVRFSHSHVVVISATGDLEENGFDSSLPTTPARPGQYICHEPFGLVLDRLRECENFTLAWYQAHRITAQSSEC